jgi:hypothetical protein
VRWFTCARCGEPVRYRHVEGSRNSNATKLTKLKDSINACAILKLKPKIQLCMKCSRELDAWVTTEFTRQMAQKRLRVSALLNRTRLL